MKRKLFWSGFFAALAVVIWLYRQQRREFEESLEAPPVRSPETLPRRGQVEADPLQEIMGIGPVFSRRLQEAGVKTFRQLAAMPADDVRAKVGLEPWQADVDSWIEQARGRLA